MLIGSIILCIILGLYALTTGIVLLFAKIEKEPDGTPVLDTDLWHFKLAYPCAKYNKRFIGGFVNGHNKISICGYFIKLFVALWIEWPLILIISAMGTIAPSVISILFGFVVIMDWRIWWDGSMFEDYFRSKKVWLPAIRGHRIWPIWLAAPAAYVWLLCLNLKLTLHWTFIVLGIIFTIAAGIALMTLLSWLFETDQKKVSLVRELLMAKKNKWCPLMKVRGTAE